MIKTEYRSCNNCDHREYGKCVVTGFYCTTEIKYPGKCGTEKKLWAERRNFIQRLFNIYPQDSEVTDGTKDQ